jgi:sugar phosphate isomerase/epimerase
MGVQLYDWSNYLSNGAGEITCPAPPAPATPDCVGPPAPSNTNDRLARVFAYLQAHNVQNVELYGYPGNPFPGTNPATPNNTAGLLALRALGDQYGLRFVSRHGNINAGNWDNDIAASRILGQEVIGAADPPSTSSLQNILNTAQLMNSLGKRSLEAGLGPVYFHNHAAIFANKVTDNGVVKSQWEALMDHTDPRYVMAQIDLFWMASGLSNDNAQMVAIYNKYANRIISFHVKDGVNPTPSAGTSNLRALGDGDVDFSTLFAAAKNKVRYYLYEYDPVTPGNNGGFNPFLTSDKSLAALKGDPAPAIGWNAPTFASAPAGTAASAANAVPIKITNIGDANLVFTNSAPSLAADADAGGNTTRDDFSIVSQDCQGKTLAPAKAAVADDPTTPDVNEAQPAVPAGSCTVNVAFKPTRTNYTSIARLQLSSNADDATERVPLVATSTGDALATVGGNVPTMLALSLPIQGGSFGTFLPTVNKAYETAVAATVTSTAGDATLSVVDPSTTAPGHLVNGEFSLPSALNVRAINASNPTQAYAPLADTALSLLTYTGPVNQDPVEIGFRQQIGSTDVLRSGSYGKTLTFTLSTTQP